MDQPSFMERSAREKSILSDFGTGRCQKDRKPFMRYAPQLKIYLGYQLSYAEEDVLCLTPRECLLLEKEGLYVGMLYNDMPQTIYSGAGLSDEWMLRTKVPMTKEEIRHLSVAKLRLTPEAVCYDIGCGSGSISVEMAMLSPGIRVYAIDSVEEAVALTRKNADRFGLKNVQVVQGMAPEGMEDFPEPTHAFIGGSRGNMAAILKNLYTKIHLCVLSSMLSVWRP